jgi:hypothetical protein
VASTPHSISTTDINAVNAAAVTDKVPQIVSVRTSDGNFAYYKFTPMFNPTTGVWSGRYSYVGAYNKSGALVDGQNTLTAAQRGTAQLQQLGAGQTFKTSQAAAGTSDQVTQYNNAVLQQWQSDAATAITNVRSQQLTDQTNQLVTYMEANNGQMPPGSLLGDRNSYVGDTGNNVFSYEAVQAAKAQYQTYTATRQQENQNAATLGFYANKPIDTSAVDKTSQTAINGYNSIGASQGGGADSGAGSRLGAVGGAAIVGQGALNHQTAAAQSYYTNMQAFGQALSAQATTDANATQTKLDADVQNVQDVATSLEQNLSQLDSQTQIAVKGQLDNLQNQIAQYQYAMQHYKDNTALIHSLAIGILALGGAIATAATGGLAGVAIAAGTAAASAAAAKG